MDKIKELELKFKELELKFKEKYTEKFMEWFKGQESTILEEMEEELRKDCIFTNLPIDCNQIHAEFNLGVNLTVTPTVRED